MKYLRTLAILICLLFILGCAIAPQPEVEKKRGNPFSLSVAVPPKVSLSIGSTKIEKKQPAYIDMDEETFKEFLNIDIEGLSLLEGIWYNDKKTITIGIRKSRNKGKYFAFILESTDPDSRQGELLAEFTETRYNHVFSTEYYWENKSAVITKSHISGKGKLDLTIFLLTLDKESVNFIKKYPITYQ